MTSGGGQEHAQWLPAHLDSRTREGGIRTSDARAQ
jgi:hypothetical protein